jgi:hypothetical protein
MNYRTAVILPLESIGTSGTKTIDINVSDPISALRFVGAFTNYSSGAQLAPIPEVFSKIELVDGSDVLFSLDGAQMVALHFYEHNPLIYVDADAVDSDVANFTMIYNFGRYLHDPILALDPKRFRNLQLKITWANATVQASAPTLTLEISAELFDEKQISPIGFLRATQFHSYSPGASTYEYIDLPTDLAIRKLYLQTKEYGQAAENELTDVRLSEDNDKRIPFDMTDTNWAALCAEIWGMLIQNYWGYGGGGTDDPIFCAPCKFESVTAINASATAAVALQGSSGGKFSFTTGTTTNLVHGILSGFLPYFVWCYAFGDEKNIDDWYDVSKVGSLRLRVYSGANASGATFNTILQQLRKY